MNTKMLITDQKELEKFYSHNRIWQGIPGIERTKNGRVFATFYSGGTTEQLGNFVPLLSSRDGISFTEPIAVAYNGEDHRCYDPCLWIDPLSRLWFIWAVAPGHAVYASICDDPDAETLIWSEQFKIGGDVMMNKPTILSTGEWLFPIAVWRHSLFAVKNVETTDENRGSFVYKTTNQGKTFQKLGYADVQNRSFDEHMILEMNDLSLRMFVRTSYGIGVSCSCDRGKTWSEGADSGFGGPCSRFFIRRLKSGRVLLINHYEFTGRNNLTAMLSDDECQTWKWKLLLDERNQVSYPDAAFDDDGNIYIIYDRERYAAREILMAKITEEDIMNGSLISEGSELKRIINKIGE
ncbi:MAG: glycoside hydrolase [Oscillospiraceae bacterium]|nr:glycoside hydrolase [Oscillospiraceae bacterium]